jgi:hypothetical protein
MRLARQQRLRQHSRKRGGYHPAPDRLRVRTVQVQAPHTLEVDRAGEGEFRPPSLLGLHHGRHGFDVVSYGCWCKNGVLVPPASPARSGLFGVRRCVLGRASHDGTRGVCGDPRCCAAVFPQEHREKRIHRAGSVTLRPDSFERCSFSGERDPFDAPQGGL